MVETVLVVIGAGPAGMMAAGTAAGAGVPTVLLDRNSRPGKKLLITGKGRCNVTNNCDIPTLMENIARNGKFCYSAFSAFPPSKVMEFFESRGVPLKTERGARVFPVSDRSQDINEALISFCREAGVRFVKADAEKIESDENGVRAVVTDSGRIACSFCVIAAGGASYSVTGSDGSGARLAASLGHEIKPLKPSLVPIICKEKVCAELAGLQLKNVSVRVESADGKRVFSDFGELLFTFFGVSGPIALSASAHLGFECGESYRINIDLKPGLSYEQLDARICRDFAANSGKDFQNSLGALLPRKIISAIIVRSGIPRNTKVSSITAEQRKKLAEAIKSFCVTAIGLRPLDEGIITSGGVSTAQLEPKTMRSRLVKGLYFAGEVIDVDAYTGGFNLQIAFSTGRSAGISIAGEYGK